MTHQFADRNDPHFASIGMNYHELSFPASLQPLFELVLDKNFAV